MDISRVSEDVGGEEEAAEQQNGKRKRDEHPAQRAKRNRYISIACNECKRRKIKCNGETPCQRCGSLRLDCVYAPNCCANSFKDSAEYKQMSAHIQSLQEQVDNLVHNLNSLRSTLGHDLPNLDPTLYNHEGRSASIAQAAIGDSTSPYRSNQPDKYSTYQATASSAYSMDVTNQGLKDIVISPLPETSLEPVTRSLQDGTTSNPFKNDTHKDPIWAISKEEALRLCRIYDEENNTMYPILDVEQVMAHAKLLFTFVEAAARSGFMQPGGPGADNMFDEDTDVLKLVLAIALVCEGGGQSDMGRRLFESVCISAEQRLLGNVCLQAIRILTLTAIYHFHSDDEALSWRVIGLTARLCLELRLHKTSGYALFIDEKSRNGALELFWSIYVLDRRWSVGTGMSFALQESDIDEDLPKPPNSSQYLSCMVSYSALLTQVRKLLGSSDVSNVKMDDINYLEYQIDAWDKSVPEPLRYIHPNSPEHTRDPAINERNGHSIYRLRLLLHLRLNQIRIHIYKPVFHSPKPVPKNNLQQITQTVADLAKDTIRVLTHVNQTSNIYHTQQMCFNHFLLSALASLILVVTHDPIRFNDACRVEFHLALDLVRGLPATSHVSKRLWRALKGLKELTERLGQSTEPPNTSVPVPDVQIQVQRSDQHPDAHSSAAMAMAGLAGHPVDESVFLAAAHSTSTNTSNPRNGTPGSRMPRPSPNGMANDLTNLFEAAGEGTLGNNGAGAGLGMAWGNEEEFSRIMKDMF